MTVLTVGKSFVYLVLVIVTYAQDYCSICPDHTMCVLPPVGPMCFPRISGGVTLADKAAIFKAHNDFRQRVALGNETLGLPGPQPGAANMRLMTWDDELATIAQRWADQCDFGHDPCRDVERFGVGQNDAVTMGYPKKDWLHVLRMWYDGVKYYDGRKVKPFSYTTKTGKYSQVVWADSYKLGCGYSEFRLDEENTWLHRMYVCNYGGAGNYIGQALYEPGRACSQCPEGTTCGRGGYPGLCG